MSSVTAYRLDPATGTLAALQTLTTLPDGYAARNTYSQIHLTASGQFLYVGNRGHNSLAGFAGAASGRLASYRIHSETGALTPLETYAVGQRPMAVLVTQLGD